MSSSCILYQNPTASISIIDVPRSLELAQGRIQQLFSIESLQKPFPSLEPKSSKAKARLEQHSIEDLIIQKHIEFSLAEIKQSFHGKWCLLRVTLQQDEEHTEVSHDAKNLKHSNECVKSKKAAPPGISPPQHLPTTTILFHNHLHTALSIVHGSDTPATLPPQSTLLLGSLSTTLPTFIHHAPKFNLIILDPPWQNRSARRKGSYELSYDTLSIRSLLSSIPLEDHVTSDGLIAVWVTNKPIFREIVLELFMQWGVEFVEEWVWLKVTENGKPVCALDGVWKKPYEILLVGRKGVVRIEEEGVKRRVIVGVPDLHSRKPSLKVLFEDLMGKKAGEYAGLEIFARNLTEGWWGWGNEVLKFQADDCWAVAEDDEGVEQIDT